MASSPDVVIIGGGVIGCAIAYELSKGKAKVLVLEKDQVGSGASYASAGMVAPLEDHPEEREALDLGVKSFRMYRSFIEEVEETAGMSVECLESGIMRVALNEEEATAAKAGLDLGQRLGIEMHWLDEREAHEVEPLLGPAVMGATFSPAEPHLTPSRLVEALRRAAVVHGATFREQSPVFGLARNGSRLSGVRLAQEVVPTDKVVLATGAWTCQAGDWLGLELPIFPVRGQVVYINKMARPLGHAVNHSSGFAVPRGDGTTLVGTTREHAGFDPRVTVGGVASILTRIQELLPSIADTTINHTRAGLRPWSTDYLPVLGPAPGAEEVIIASGHFRSGILLTPVTARMIADYILKGPESVELGPFAASRLERRPE